MNTNNNRIVDDGSGRIRIYDGDNTPRRLAPSSMEEAERMTDLLNAGKTEFEVYLTTLPKEGKMHVIRHRTGCSCCGQEIEFEGPYLSKDLAAETMARRSKSFSGTHSLHEVSYEISGRWIILNGWYAASCLLDSDYDYNFDLEKFAL